MIIKPRRITRSTPVEKKEEPKVIPVQESTTKVNTVKKTPRKIIIEEEEDLKFSFDDEESK